MNLFPLVEEETWDPLDEILMEEEYQPSGLNMNYPHDYGHHYINMLPVEEEDAGINN